MGRLFGTDGVRGVANQELTPELAFRLGRATAHVLLANRKQTEEAGRILIGRDTRVSGEMLEAALVAGVTSTGAQAVLFGVIPTPAVAYLTPKLGADAGVMISASHNPIADNGIKIFDANGYKLTDEVEDEIESYLEAPKAEAIARPTGLGVGRVVRQDGDEAYASFLAGTVGGRFDGISVVLDCAYGATYRIAPQVFTALGAKVVTLNNKNDGSRINVQCGATAPQELQEAVVKHQAQLGLAYDGDGDRVIAVDEKGTVLDGDHIMGICGLQMLADGILPHQAIVVTVYSNLGLLETFRKAGGEVIVTDNGDRKVLAAMLERGIMLGGEQSGHIIFLEHNSTGDGILTSLQLMATMLRAGKPLSELREQIKKFPQLLANVHSTRKDEWMENEKIRQVVARLEAQLGESGRIFIRASGTEALIRVMVEGPDEAVLKSMVEEITAVIKAELA